MNIVKIKKDTHAPLRLPQLVRAEDGIRFCVMFTPSCRYDLGNEDQADVNKLFGIGFFPSHKIHSARFGWRYNPNIKMIEILTYVRINGQFKFVSMGFLNINHWYLMELLPLYNRRTGKDSVLFKINGGDVPNYGIDIRERMVYMPVKRWGYLLRPYFGGNQTAPHDMEIHMDRV